MQNVIKHTHTNKANSQHTLTRLKQSVHVIFNHIYTFWQDKPGHLSQKTLFAREIFDQNYSIVNPIVVFDSAEIRKTRIADPPRASGMLAEPFADIRTRYLC